MKPVGGARPVSPPPAPASSPRRPTRIDVPFGPTAPTNGVFQSAWQVREALERRLASVEASPAADVFRRVFADLKAGRVARQSVHLAIADLARGRDRFDPHALALELLARPVAELEAAFAKVYAPVPARAERRAAPLRAMGHSVARSLATSEPGPRRTALFEAVPTIGPAVLGAIARATGAEPERFAAELEATDDATFADVVDFADRRVSRAELLEIVAGRPSGVGAIAIDPASPALESTRTSMALVAHHWLDLPLDLAESSMLERQRTATLLVERFVRRLGRRLGPERVERALQGFDLAAEAAAIADPRDGQVIHANLADRSSMRTKLERLEKRIALLALADLGPAFKSALRARPELGELRGLLAGLDPASPVGAVLLAELALRHADVPRTGRFGAHLLDVAEALGRPGALESVAARVVAEIAEDKDLVASIAELRSELAELAAAAAEERASVQAFEATLDAGRVPIPAELRAEVEAHFAATFPDEGMGYLVAHGDALSFFPIRNDLAGTIWGPGQGRPNEEDLDRVNAFLAETSGRAVAYVHSHPRTSPLFSDLDLASAAPHVALDRRFRTVIVGVDDADQPDRFRWASFASSADGQIAGEDTL